MPRIPRKFLFDPTEMGTYHCVNRCVRRAFLCGTDQPSGRCFDHRKTWIQERLEYLAGQFAVDVMAFSVMSNHLHVVVRNRPDVVRGWSDREVARRWWNVFPGRRDQRGQPAEPTESELRVIMADAAHLAVLRARLSSLSWFMRCLAEPIARRANREDNCTGRFWEGRYKCQPVLDEPALAACLAYVDLNPVRARVAETPESSQFTSVFERIHARPLDSQREPHSDGQADVAPPAGQGPPLEPAAVGPSVRVHRTRSNGHTASRDIRSAWLSPFELSETATAEPAPPARASNLGCLPMRFARYLALLDWTSRQLRAGNRASKPIDPAPIPERLCVTSDGWLRLVQDFSRLFRRAAGTPASLRRDADKWGRRRVSGISQSRALFASSPDAQRN